MAKTIVQVGELDDYVDMLRKAKPDNIFFVVEVGQQQNPETKAIHLIGICKLTAVKDETLYTQVSNVGNLVVENKETDMKTFGDQVKEATEVIIKKLQRDCPGSRLWKGAIGLM